MFEYSQSPRSFSFRSVWRHQASQLVESVNLTKLESLPSMTADFLDSAWFWERWEGLEDTAKRVAETSREKQEDWFLG